MHDHNSGEDANVRGEFDYISWLRFRTPADARVQIGPGDDCAAILPPQRELLMTTDMLMEGTDFVLSDIDPRRIGRKAMAVNLSDIAAMAGVPTAAVVSVALPVGPQSRTLAESLYFGLRDVADAFAVSIVGGDTNSWNGPLVISVTAFGEATARGPVRRNGARPGDWLFVTGPCGGSLRGHHLDFTPRVREALALHEVVDLHAMIDISDGLTADLQHILDESRCGAVLAAAAIPVATAAIETSRTSGQPPLVHALGDGEDFELIFAVTAEDGAKLLAHSPVPVWNIGVCIDEGLWLEADGVREVLEPKGWVHDFSTI